jgi:hypothetical protein
VGGTTAAGGTSGGSSAVDAGRRDVPADVAADVARDTRGNADTTIVVFGDGGASSSTGNDNCTDSVASNLTLQQIAVYQSLKIPVMADGAEVAVASRKSSVIVGRDTMFRAFVTPGTGWTARELSARLTLTLASGSSTQYYVKKTVSVASTDDKLDSTFQIFVPASAMTGSMRYSLQIVECGSTASGSAGTARFPTSGDSDLGVKATGALKITIIPIQVGTFSPDTSQKALDFYASTMNAMYPITGVSLTVGTAMTVTSPVDWSGTLQTLQTKRIKDAPPADTYYFGLIKPADTLRAYCGTSCTSGIGFVATSATQSSGRVSMGVGFADKASAMTMAHEIGHNHGRSHSPCVPSGGSISGVDSKYPYTKAGLGSWGWDPRTQTLFDPAKPISSSNTAPYNTDIMGYCNIQWISDYTYTGLTTRVAAVNGNPAAMVLTVAGEPSKWRVLLLEAGRGPRWGTPIDIEIPPEGDSENASIYDKTGAVLTTAVVYRTEIGDMDARMIWVPEPKPDWYAVGVPGYEPLPFAAPGTTPLR